MRMRGAWLDWVGLHQLCSRIADGVDQADHSNANGVHPSPSYTNPNSAKRGGVWRGEKKRKKEGRKEKKGRMKERQRERRRERFTPVQTHKDNTFFIRRVTPSPSQYCHGDRRQEIAGPLAGIAREIRPSCSLAALAHACWTPPSFARMEAQNRSLH